MSLQRSLPYRFFQLRKVRQTGTHFSVLFDFVDFLSRERKPPRIYQSHHPDQRYVPSTQSRFSLSATQFPLMSYLRFLPHFLFQDPDYKTVLIHRAILSYRFRFPSVRHIHLKVYVFHSPGKLSWCQRSCCLMPPRYFCNFLQPHNNGI